MGTIPTMTASTSAQLMPLREIAGNPPTHLYPMQELLVPYTGWLIAFWFALWCMTAVVLIYRLAKEFRSCR